MLQKAKAGIYLPSQVDGLDPKYLNKYFTQLENGNWAIADSIKGMVVFKQHDLLKDPYERNFDLILCRNVFIYFTSTTQKRLITSFVQSSIPAAILSWVLRNRSWIPPASDWSGSATAFTENQRKGAGK